MGLSREDRKDLARAMMSENPLTTSREMIYMERLLECDNRLLGISNEQIVIEPEDYEGEVKNEKVGKWESLVRKVRML